MDTVPTVELDINWPVKATVPTVKLDIYQPVIATVQTVEVDILNDFSNAYSKYFTIKKML